MLHIVRDDNGLELELANDQVITVEKPCSLFNDSDKFITDISYQLMASFTRRNHLFFNNANQVDTPSQKYNFPVTTSEDTLVLNKGNINASVREKGYQFNLEPNYTALNALTNGVRLPEIKTSDKVTFANSAALATQMLDTVQNPDKYPYIFFPVYNTGQADPAFGAGVHFVNYFNTSTHTFNPAPLTGSTTYSQSPFFKLSYIIKQVCNYLGFTATGGFFTDPAFKNLCVYTRRSNNALVIYPCMMYMPNITVPQFLKILRDRYHIASDFDLGAGVATFETLSTIAASVAPMDITKYVGNVIEQEIPPGNGYKVTLKSDEQDELFRVASTDQDTYPPLYQLVAGSGEQLVELDISTLKAVAPADAAVAGATYCITKQSTINKNCWNGRLIGVKNWPGLPPDLTPTDPSDPSTTNNWPLRLINYLGYNAVTGGGSFPCSEPADLNTADINYWRFMNDSKRLIITAYFPAVVLAGLKNTIKYCMRTSGYDYCEFKTENITYDKKVTGDTLVATKIYARTLKFDINTKVQIQPVGPALPDSPYTVAQVKAYFDNSIHGLDQLNVEVWSTGTAIGHNFYTVQPIVNPTNAGGATGSISGIVVQNTVGSDLSYLNQAEIRVTQGNPRYLEYLGVRTNFTFTGSYWRVPIDMIADYAYEFNEPYWIVF